MLLVGEQRERQSVLLAEYVSTDTKSIARRSRHPHPIS
jgi:hypothetical protein